MPAPSTCLVDVAQVAVVLNKHWEPLCWSWKDHWDSWSATDHGDEQQDHDWYGEIGKTMIGMVESGKPMIGMVEIGKKLGMMMVVMKMLLLRRNHTHHSSRQIASDGCKSQE